MSIVSASTIRARRAALAAGALLALLGASHSQSQTIAQQPLFLGEKASPNVVYNIDESWSMAWRYMPDEVIENGVSIYGNPWATSSGDSGDSNGFRWVLSFHPHDVSTGGATSSGNDAGTADGVTRTIVARAAADGTATDLISARLRSPAFNTIYYDPEVRYRPWYYQDGTTFPDAAPAAAPLNPNNPAAGTVNLVGEQTFGGTNSTTRTLSGPGSCSSSTWSAWQTIPEFTTITSYSSTGTCSGNASQIETSGNQYRFRRFPSGGRTITFTESTSGGIWCKSLDSSTANATTTSNRSVDNNGSSGTASCHEISGETLAPAVYYTYNGNGLRTASNFTRVRIMDHATFQRGTGRSDCAAIAAGSGNTCTQAEEYQNFANWFTYNRTRMFASIAATSRAFSEQGDNLRVGYARIHGPSMTLDGVSSPGSMVRGVRKFADADREQFFTWLHGLGGQANNPASPTSSNRRSLYGTTVTHHQFAGGTPLRQAMDDVGQYYMRTDNSGPWGNTPGTNDPTAQLSCRKSYHILMTDGMWTGSNSNTTGTSNTARHADRRANVDGTAGPTITGPGDLSYQYQPIAPYSDNTSNTLADVAMYYWNRDLRTNLTNNVPPDAFNPAFWQNMVNFTVGFGVSGTLAYPGDWPALQAGTKSWPNSFNANTASTIDDLWHAAVNSRGEYLSAANPEQFAVGLSGILSSVAAREGASSSTAAINSTSLNTESVVFRATFSSTDWSGRLRAYSLDEETGEFDENAPLWDTNTTLTRALIDDRNLFIAHGLTGTVITSAVALDWDELDDTVQAVISDTDDDRILQWVRGSAADESTTLRRRTHLLGDIVNSNPLFLGDKENYGYRFLPGAEGSSYLNFLTNVKGGRRPMVYVGANDGMLHGFDAETGSEVFGFIPAGVAANLKTLASPLYTHLYFVDGSPSATDAYLNGSWKTVLVGSTGAGGRSVFAIDVTDPDDITPDNFMWEFSTAPDDTHQLGVAMNNPVIGRVKANNKWVAIFGNGYESGDTAKLMVVDLETGDLIRAIDTGATGPNNGLAPPFAVDLTGDGITDLVYAGDLQGAMWRFDLRNASAASWTVAKIFQATDDSNLAQPITARVEVGKHPKSGVMVYFGTGKYFQDGDNIVSANPQVQTLYGVHDDFDGFVARERLVPQAILFQGIPTLATGGTGALSRVISQKSASECESENTCRGWMLNLKAPSPATANGERSVSRPILRHRRVSFTTIIPNDDPCLFGGQSWQMEFDAITGGRTERVVFDLNGDRLFNEGDYVEILIDGETKRVVTSGLYIGELSTTPAVVAAGNTDLNITTQGGQFFTSGSGNEFSRQSWRQLQ